MYGSRTPTPTGSPLASKPSQRTGPWDAARRRRGRRASSVFAVPFRVAERNSLEAAASGLRMALREDLVHPPDERLGLGIEPRRLAAKIAGAMRQVGADEVDYLRPERRPWRCIDGRDRSSQRRPRVGGAAGARCSSRLGRGLRLDELVEVLDAAAPPLRPRAALAGSPSARCSSAARHRHRAGGMRVRAPAPGRHRAGCSACIRFQKAGPVGPSFGAVAVTASPPGSDRAPYGNQG